MFGNVIQLQIQFVHRLAIKVYKAIYPHLNSGYTDWNVLEQERIL